MESTTTRPSEVPAYIPTELLVDFDIYNPLAHEADDVHRAWGQLMSGLPIVWTPRNGGHWIAARGALIREIQTNHKLFSHKSVTIPRSDSPSIPVELDPPLHTAFRGLLSPLFSPPTLKFAEARARELVVTLIDAFVAQGRCEFQHDVAMQVPICVFLDLMGLSHEDRHVLLPYAHKRNRCENAHDRDVAKAFLVSYLRDKVSERRSKPGADFISRLLNGRVDDREITDWELENLLFTLLVGGLDTVASMMGFVMRFLATHLRHQQQLVADPKNLNNAVDELIRRHGIVNTARVVTSNCTFHGVELRANDQIVVPNALFGLDAAEYKDPYEVDFYRQDNKSSAAFGNGPHRCVGANLARLEVRVLLQEWSKRIPAFCLDPDYLVRMNCGIVSTITELHLKWDVGHRVGQTPGGVSR